MGSSTGKLSLPGLKGMLGNGVTFGALKVK